MRAARSARGAAIVAALFLMLIALSAQFSGNISTVAEPATTYIVKQSAAPTDTTVYWIDSDNGRGYNYYGGEWLGPEDGPYIFAKGGTGISGALNICGVAAMPCDTTTDSENGYLIPYRARITKLIGKCQDAVPPAGCSLQVFDLRAERLKLPWTVLSTNFTVAAANTIAANGIATAWIRSGSNNPDTLNVEMYIRERAAP